MTEIIFEARELGVLDYEPRGKRAPIFASRPNAMAKITKSSRFTIPSSPATLSAILNRVAAHHRLSADDLLKLLNL